MTHQHTISIYQTSLGRFAVHLRGLPDREFPTLAEAAEHAETVQAANVGPDRCRIVIRREAGS